MKRSVRLAGWTGFFLVLLVLWQLAAAAIHNSLILPEPMQVLDAMIGQLNSPDFFMTIGGTFLRVILAIAASIVIGVFLAFLAAHFKTAAFFLDKAILILRSIPNISFIILALFWLNSTQAVFVVLVLLIMPVIYSAVCERLNEIEKEYKDLLVLFPQPWHVRFRDLYLPELEGTFLASLTTAVSLGLKGGVMAEVLCQVPVGIGHSLQADRFALETAGVIGWTIWLLLVTFLTDSLIRTLSRHIADRT